MRAAVLVVAAVLLAGCFHSAPPPDPAEAYRALLESFGEEDPGLVRDEFSTGRSHQAEVYALIASAEAGRLREEWPEGATRFSRSMAALLDHPDADGDGLPGWGLPDAWDAIGDGSTNPAHQAYAIDTGIAVHALLDGLALVEARNLTGDPPFDVAKARRLVEEVCRRWTAEVFTLEEDGGYYWYSPRPMDAVFVPNVSAYLLGAC